MLPDRGSSGLVTPFPTLGKSDWELSEAELHKRRESVYIVESWSLSRNALETSDPVYFSLPGPLPWLLDAAAYIEVHVY